ncbi:beta-1,3-galactosyltransferase 5-like [Haliotis rufescens]|uniref:beta-1,3-galactosyltransferase 5-like n=1 Tax=Haliotis rufescens TaxID=6454 RepID=UPI00201E9A6D|nr:beta-1,3-galactosyltransferase 5-like [Haliotis rufescens]
MRKCVIVPCIVLAGCLFFQIHYLFTHAKERHISKNRNDVKIQQDMTAVQTKPVDYNRTKNSGASETLADSVQNEKRKADQTRTRKVQPFQYRSVIKEYTSLINWSYFTKERNKVLTKYSFDSFDILPESTKTDDQPYLIIMVLSVAHHSRTAIRKTYGSVSRGLMWPGSNLPLNTKVIFLLGRTSDIRHQVNLHAESNIHGDILQGNFIDSYENLTLKVLAGLHYVAEYHPGTQYVLKADEDTFTDVDLVVRLLKTLQPLNSVLGHVYEKPFVDRNGKWSISESVYPFPLFPNYVSGNTYVLSMDYGKCILENAKYYQYIFIEDVFITGMMSFVCNATLYHVSGFTFWAESRPVPKTFLGGAKISGTRVTDTLKYGIWTYLNNWYHTGL